MIIFVTFIKKTNADLIHIMPKGLAADGLYQCGNQKCSGKDFMEKGIDVLPPEYLYESRKLLIEMI